MHRFAVGELYHPNRTRWPEQPQIKLLPAGCELLLPFGDPTKKEIQDVKTGNASFALIKKPHVAVLGFRLGSQPWSDASFEVHRQPADENGPLASEVGAGQGLLLHVVLIDAFTGIIKVLRVTTWPADFADAMRTLATEQLAAPYDPHAAGIELAQLYQLDTDTLISQADFRC